MEQFLTVITFEYRLNRRKLRKGILRDENLLFWRFSWIQNLFVFEIGANCSTNSSWSLTRIPTHAWWCLNQSQGHIRKVKNVEFFKILRFFLKINFSPLKVNQFDVLYRSGYFSKDKELHKPYVPGSDCSGGFWNWFYNLIGYLIWLAVSENFPASIWKPIKGIIVQKGRHVTEFQLNDRVYTTISTKTGTYARYVVASGRFC